MSKAAIDAKTVLSTICRELIELFVELLSAEVWVITEKLCKLLNVFDDATHNQSGQSYISLSTTNRFVES